MFKFYIRTACSVQDRSDGDALSAEGVGGGVQRTQHVVLLSLQQQRFGATWKGRASAGPFVRSAAKAPGQGKGCKRGAAAVCSAVMMMNVLVAAPRGSLARCMHHHRRHRRRSISLQDALAQQNQISFHVNRISIHLFCYEDLWRQVFVILLLFSRVRYLLKVFGN